MAYGDARYDLINHPYLHYGVQSTAGSITAGAAAVIIATASVTILLANPAPIGKAYYVKRAAGAGGDVTISGGGANIDGAASAVLKQDLDAILVVGDGVNWQIIASHRAPPPGP